MKAYTDIGQSKKLASILPIESADFHFSANLSPKGYLEKPIWGNLEYADYSAFPCWSLMALIETMPEILIERVKAQDGYDGYYYFVTYEELIKVPYKKELIDACVEMIIKLHEEKLL